MQTKVNDNLGGLFKAQTGTLGQLKVPMIGLYLPVPISLDVVPRDIDPVDEKKLLAKASEAIAKAMPKLAQEVEKALTAALKASVWGWPTGLRDIYDTGELARSVEVTAQKNGINVSYSAPYAGIVHDGGYIHPYGNMSARPVYLPGRPWVSSVLYGGGPVPQFDFEDFLRKEVALVL